MPIYAYRCNNCGCEKEVLQKISDPALVNCPECGANQMSKMITAAGFQLKGSGWYVTDFKDKGSNQADKNKTKEHADNRAQEASNKTSNEKAQPEIVSSTNDASLSSSQTELSKTASNAAKKSVNAAQSKPKPASS